MKRGVLTVLTLASVVFFPWPFTVILAIISAGKAPLVPFAAGILADTLYYTPYAHVFPLFTLYGFMCTVIAFIVRNRVRASIMR